MINVKQVVTMAKAAGKFLLFERKDQNDFTEHFFMTPNFILHIDAQEAFKIRCRLDIEKLGYWCEIKKGETVQGISPVETEKLYENYIEWIVQAENVGEPLTLTGLMIAEYNHQETQYLLAVGRGGYTALLKGQVEMVLAAGETRRVGHYVVMDGQQVIGVMPDDVWRGTPYLVPVKQMNDHAEAGEENEED